MPHKTLYLLDGHSLVYKSFHAVTNLTTASGEPTGAIYGFLTTLQRIRKSYEPGYIAVVFDPKGPSFRKEVFEAYKANRPPQPPELGRQLELLREVLSAMGIPVFERAPFEADDLLASMARWAVDNGGEACIVSVDKDLLQCVGDGITVLREHLGKIEMLDTAGVLAKMGVRPDQVPAYLGLLGDTSDNIPGVPGIGKKRATELLGEYGSLEAILAEAEGKTKPKFWANLAEYADKALLSRELATVKSDIDLGLSWDGLEWEYQPSPELRAHYQRLEFRSLLEELGGATVAERETDYATVTTGDGLAGVVAALEAAEVFALDTETSGDGSKRSALDPYRADLVGISLSWRKDQAVYIPVGSRGLALETVRQALAPVLSGAPRLVAHNWRFDAQILERQGFGMPDAAYDTMIAAYVLNPDRPSKGLKALALECLGIKMTEYESLKAEGQDLVDLATADVEDVSEYACQDADATLQLYTHFEEQFASERELAAVLRDIEVPLASVLARMELQGIRIDLAYFRDLAVETKRKLEQLTDEIHRLAGRPFNINSPKQLAQILFDEIGLAPTKKTASGNSTDVTVLEALKDQHELPALLLEYRQLEKLRGTYIQALPLLVNPHTGRIHTSLHQTVAATGRLSSSEPNLQNIPVRTEAGRQIRRGFIPRAEGWLLMAADYSQIELRILAHISRDAALVEAFNGGDDIHALTASKVFKVERDAVTREMRGQAKAVNFGIIYGMTPFRLARDMGLAQGEARRFIDDYFAVYRGVKEYIDATIESCRETGYVRTLAGRRRYIADIKSSNRNARTQAERVAVNTPIQGSSADMIKLAMLAVDREMRAAGMESRMILQVHDELIFDVAPGEAGALESLVRTCMADAMPLDVPVQVDVATGSNWAEIK